MKLKCVIFLLAFQLQTCLLSAQPGNDFTLSFRPEFSHTTVSFDGTYYKLQSGDSVSFETLKFYISGIEFLLNNKTVWEEAESFHLIDAANEKSLQLVLPIPPGISFDHVKFNLGIDSLTNVSGAMGGDLDPTKGMYWTWQNGYINFKLEGHRNFNKSRNNEFQFHLGGYQFPFNAIQPILLSIHQGNSIGVNVELEKIVEGCNFINNNIIMSPSKEAVALSRKVADAFITSEK